MNYDDFIFKKQHSSIDYGIPLKWMPNKAFDYQEFLAEKGTKKGRFAEFCDTGTGKTLIELIIAHNYVLYTNKPILIITPLAVAEQHIKESIKFDIPDVEHTKNGKYSKKIILINYERLHYLNPSDFDCVILDESSILKNFEGKMKQKITSFLKKVKYRFLFTATPSPNDYIELGTSSEALGYLGYMDMLSKFFKNNNNNVAKISQIYKARAGEKWYLKPHAEKDFWKWVSTWSISMRKPSDLGFSDELHKLPKLIENIVTVKNDNPLPKNGQMSMFNFPAVNFHEIKQEVRNTIEKRCDKAVLTANNHDTTVYWVNLNDEADLIESYDKNAIQIKGSMSIDRKEELLKAFSNGEIKKLITKPKITSFGLNWQHCGHTVFFPSFSYEQYYQSLRRFYRFGRKEDVIADLVISDGQTRIIDSLMAKKQKANEMFECLVSHINSSYELKTKEFNKEILTPNFI